MYIESKKMLITIIVLVFIILGLGGFITYDKFFKKEEKTRTVINDVSIDLTQFFNIGYILDKMDKSFSNNNTVFYGTIYNKNTLNISKLDMSAAIYAAIDGNTDSSVRGQTITGKKVKSDFEKMFTKDLKYIATSINAGDNYKMVYDQATDTYAYRNTIEGTKKLEDIIAVNTSTEIKESKIVVKRKIFYVEYSVDANGNYQSANIYKKANKSGLVGKVNLTSKGAISTDEVLGKYGSKISTYYYTFKEENPDEYRLYSIEKAF